MHITYQQSDIASMSGTAIGILSQKPYFGESIRAPELRAKEFLIKINLLKNKNIHLFLILSGNNSYY